MGTISLPWIPIALVVLLLGFPETAQRWLGRAGKFMMIALLVVIAVNLFWG